MADFTVVIPARLHSTRLPGKPLADIAGVPMVVRVAQQARASSARQVLVATDHDDIAAAVRRHGFAAIVTAAEHVSGTDRLAEVARRENFADEHIVVNVQGDEPLIDPALIRAVADDLAGHPTAALSTACYPLRDRSAFLNPNVVKVVLDRDGYALYFSRAPIPYPRDGLEDADELPSSLPAFRHIGLYAYRAAFLRAYAALPPAPLERIESLEQLRALWHGHKISVAVTDEAPAGGVDTAEDLERVRAVFAGLAR